MKKILALVILISALALAQTANRYAVVDDQGKVQNVVVYDGDDPVKLPNGWSLIRLTTNTLFVQAGCEYSRQTRTFTCPQPE